MSGITNTSSFFIDETALFGAYPTQQQIKTLEEWGVELIVDLTKSTENKIIPYTTKCPTIKFTIPDGDVPNEKVSWLFFALVYFLADQISNNKKIYIHCKAGHGRASLLVCVLLCYIKKIPPYEAFNITTLCHSKRLIHSSRPIRNEYWKYKRFPQHKKQQDFIEACFQTYKIPEQSPFIVKNEWETKQYDEYLITTGLGKINGINGAELEQYRENLYKTLALKYFQYKVKENLFKEKECF